MTRSLLIDLLFVGMLLLSLNVLLGG